MLPFFGNFYPEDELKRAYDAKFLIFRMQIKTLKLFEFIIQMKMRIELSISLFICIHAAMLTARSIDQALTHGFL